MIRDVDLETVLRVVCVWIVVTVVVAIVASDFFVDLGGETMALVNAHRSTVCEGWGCLPFWWGLGVGYMVAASLPVAIALYWIWDERAVSG